MVKAGTPLLALYGATAGVAAITYVNGAINQAILAMVPKGIDGEFLYQWLSANRSAIIDRYTQGGQPNLSGAIVRRIEMPVPPLTEQRAIVSALNGADGAVEVLEQLIAKKQAIKQGMMQQLLSGKIRLSGHTGRWTVKDLAELAAIDPEALTPQTSPTEIIDYISLEDVSRGVLLSSSRLAFRNAPSRARRVVREMDVLFGTVRPNLQSHVIYTGGLSRPIASTGFAVVRAISNRADPRFLFFLLMSNLASVQIDRIIAGSNYPAVSSGDVRRLLFEVPDVREQAAIGAALADCDAELRILNLRLSKARAIKQGMTQELLTSRTHLPVKEPAV